jgi:heme exporter protein D
MYFASLNELFYMDGHGVYVWAVYAVAVSIIGVLAVSPLLRRRRFVRDEVQRLRREGKITVRDPL